MASRQERGLGLGQNEVEGGSVPRIHYDLYVVLDIDSRYGVHWLLAAHADVERAKAFMEDAIVLQGGAIAN